MEAGISGSHCLVLQNPVWVLLQKSLEASRRYHGACACPRLLLERTCLCTSAFQVLLEASAGPWCQEPGGGASLQAACGTLP